jgi:predicted AAA+ superfamily ATPase
MALKPWYKVVTPREDLRSGQPLDASEFAVHLDQIRDGRAPGVYQNPAEFFDRTFLTRNLRDVGAEVIRRLSGTRTETSAVFNMTTQFGGGKTHALTLLYHLAANGPAANGWTGVPSLLDAAGVRSVPRAATAVFVGTEFDSITGRGGTDGTPVRRTPWGEVAYQLGGEAALQVVQEHEEQGVAPAGDVIRAFLPADRACLILMDELMNYVSRNRRSGLAAQLYNFLQNLSEEARGRDNMVLAVSVPASELEMNADDQEDYERFKKLLDRVGKAVFMSVDEETSEIIRRRLFEWDERLLTPDGRVQMTRDALATSEAYATWILDHRQQLPTWFPVDSAREAFAATYPFHPMVLSVFERKWQALPRFQRTRGVLRLLALWVSRAYADGFKGAHRDPLISLGTAPLDEPFFRAAMFEQLGTSRLEAAITTDICGKKDSHIEVGRPRPGSFKRSGVADRSHPVPAEGRWRPRGVHQRELSGAELAAGVRRMEHEVSSRRLLCFAAVSATDEPGCDQRHDCSGC